MSSRCKNLALSVLLLGTAAPAHPAAEVYRYRMSWEPQRETLRIDVCAPPGVDSFTLVATQRSATEHLVDADDASGSTDRRGRMRFADGCGSYRVDVGRLADSRRIGHGFRSGDDLLLWQSAWLWWPQAREARVELAVKLPTGWHLSAPWPRLGGDPSRYRLHGWPRSWPGMVALTRESPVDLQHHRGVAHLAVLGDLDNARRSMLRLWIEEAFVLLDRVAGGLPLPEVQVLVVPIRGGRGPVPWAQVLRAGTGGVHFFVDAERPLADFRNDWTAPHEVAHLLHPYLGHEGRWMAEGLASYYQNLLRVRAGEWDERRFWRRLLAGFERGRRSPVQALPLRQAAVEMRARNANMRVYWSGAAYWLQADVALRQASDGELGLDEALARFADCCLPATRRWTPLEFAARLDALVGLQVFAPLAQSAARESGFPDIEPLLDELGVRTNSQGRPVALDAAAPAAATRRAMMAPVARVP